MARGLFVRTAAARGRADSEPPAAGRRELLLAGLGGALTASGASVPLPAQAAAPASIYELSANMYGAPVSFEQFKGKVLVVVNVASQ